MLHTFLTENRERIIARASRGAACGAATPLRAGAEPENALALFLAQLVGMLATSSESGAETEPGAARPGDADAHTELTVGQVVHDYGRLRQAITEIAAERGISVGSSEFRRLNGCFDDAIASAVSDFAGRRERALSGEAAEHIGIVVHELRNALNAATLAFEVLKAGAVDPGEKCDVLLDRSLTRMREIIDRSLAEVRLKAGIQKRTRLSVAQLIADVALAGAVEARQRGLELRVGPVAGGVSVEADPHLLGSALGNLLQNSFKFTRPRSRVSLQTFATPDQVRIEIEDECGGLPTQNFEELFQIFEQMGKERSGLGLGLAISQRGVEASGGKIHVRDLPGKGCIFAVELPRQK